LFLIARDDTDAEDSSAIAMSGTLLTEFLPFVLLTRATRSFARRIAFGSALMLVRWLSARAKRFSAFAATSPLLASLSFCTFDPAGFSNNAVFAVAL